MKNKVLIVEDEPIIAEDLKMIVLNAGYHVSGIANNGTSALDLLHNRAPDIVLLDIALDGNMSGIDIAKIIDNKYDIPFIYITSFTDEVTLEMANMTMPSGYITKPFKKKDIIANLKISLHRHYSKSKGVYLTIEEINKNLTRNLSIREYEIAIDLCQGLTNQQLSEKYSVSINTIKTQLKRIFLKIDISNRSQISIKLQRGK